MKNVVLKYDLSQKRPVVLLVGNGMVCQNGLTWEQLIEKIATKEIDGYDFSKIPNNILTLATANIQDKERRNDYQKAMDGMVGVADEVLAELVKLPFDAILTTNYGYEIEQVFKSNFAQLKSDSNYHGSLSNIRDAKYILQTYNKIGNSPEIFHIHGEIRRKSSLILMHDEYARLLHKLIEYNKKRGNDYQNFFGDFKVKAWSDFFMIADIYIVGFGFSFDEFDLWWLLSRRLRERAETGKIFFYEPNTENNRIKQKALQDCGVCCENCGVTISENQDKNQQYRLFYQQALKDIAERLKKDGIV